MNPLTDRMIDVAERALDYLDEMEERGLVDNVSNRSKAFNVLMAIDPLINIGEDEKVKILKHNVHATYNFMMARWKPEEYCCSGRCEDTNWGGKDRLHIRSENCPAHDDDELLGYLRAAGATPKLNGQ